MDLAIIVPALNEREALPGLIGEIDAACGTLGLEWETLVIDDGSTDGTFEKIEELAADERAGRGDPAASQLRQVGGAGDRL